jgi:ribosome biogenesis GTPase
MSLEALGWNELRRKQFSEHAAVGLVPGRVVGEHRSHYRVATEAAEVTAAVSGRLYNTARERSDLPGVGDFVAVRRAEGDGPAKLEAVLPRTTALIRRASGAQRPQLLAANIDVAFIVTAADGDFNLPRIERYLALVREGGAEPVILLNKSDLAHDLMGPISQVDGIAPGLPVHIISARDSDSIREVARYFQGKSDDCPHWFVGRRQVDIGQSTDWGCCAGDTRDPCPRQSRPSYDHTSTAIRETGRWGAN